MKGKSVFDANTVARIRALLSEKVRSTRDQQKRIRDDIRDYGFYISDFCTSSRGFTTEDFDALIRTGEINVGG